MQVFESTNKVVRAWFVRSNKHNVDRDVAESMATSRILYHMADGGQWCHDNAGRHVHQLTDGERYALRFVLDRESKGPSPGTLLKRVKETTLTLAVAAQRMAQRMSQDMWPPGGPNEAYVLALLQQSFPGLHGDSKVRVGHDIATTDRRASNGWVERKGGIGQVVATVKDQSTAKTVVFVRPVQLTGVCEHLGYETAELLLELHAWSPHDIGRGACLFHDCWRAEQRSGEACMTGLGKHSNAPMFVVNKEVQ